MHLISFLRRVLAVVGLSALGLVAIESALVAAPPHAGPARVVAGAASAGPAVTIDRAIPRLRRAQPSPVAAAAANHEWPSPISAPPPQPKPSAAPPCGKVVDVNLTTQELVASACGQVYTRTPITSGRPGLRTPTGAFSIFFKEQDVYFDSPWPAGDPNYYPPMFVAYAMEFLDGGFFLHTDPDEPAGAFGPGSENGPYASHGCVHVPVPVMVSLYAWADDGTTVSVHY